MVQKIVYVPAPVESEIIFNAVQVETTALRPDGKVISVWRTTYCPTSIAKFKKMRQFDFVSDSEGLLTGLRSG